MWVRFLNNIFVLLLCSKREEERKGSCLKPIYVRKGLMKMLVNYIMASGLKNVTAVFFIKNLLKKVLCNIHTLFNSTSSRIPISDSGR